jgi:hypothetical protein
MPGLEDGPPPGARGGLAPDGAPASSPGPGPLLVGLAFLAHPLEEAATDFPLWLRAHVGGSLGPGTFILVNLVGLAAVTAAVGLHRRRGGRPVLPVAVGTLMVVNAALHAGAALLTLAYVPGLVTAVLVWAPLGVRLVREGAAAGRPVVVRGALLGASAQALATLAALFG